MTSIGATRPLWLRVTAAKCLARFRLWLVSGLVLGACALEAPPDVETPAAIMQEALGVYPANPHYFVGSDGSPILFLSHADSAVPTGLSTEDWHWYLDQAALNGLNLVKLVGCSVSDMDDPQTNFIQPYQRVTAHGTTTFGNPKWDLDQFNDDFFTLLSDVAAYAQNKGIYVQVQIWNHITLKAGSLEHLWDGSAFNPGNTITDTAAYGFPGNGGSGTAKFYGSLNNPVLVHNKTILQRQEELFDRVVNATMNFSNTFYELGQEVTTSNTAWAKHWVDRLRAHAPGKLIIADIQHYTGDRSFFDGYTRHQSSATDDSIPEALYGTGKMAIEDTGCCDDWAGGDLKKARKAAWFAVVSGTHFTDFRSRPNLLVDAGTPSIDWKYPAIPRQLGYIRKLITERRIPFASMTPSDGVATNGADVLSDSRHYLAYSSGGNFTLNLPAGSYTAEWFDPRTGSYGSRETISGGIQSFALPSVNDWALYVTADVVSDLSVASGRAYAWFDLASAELMYIDRTHVFNSPIPASLDGALTLRTAADDKFSSTGSTLVSFRVNQPSTVYVLYTTVNTRLENTWLTPANGWSLEDYTVPSTLPNTQALRKVRSKSFASGETVTLPGNGSTSNTSSMYNVVVVPRDGRTYSTNFPLTENPISEDANWVAGQSAGNHLWGDVQTNGTMAFGVSEPTPFGDPTAILTGPWGPDQSARAVVKLNQVPTGTCCNEVEVRLRTTINPVDHTITGYEVYCSVLPDVPYCRIATWGGPNGSYANIAFRRTYLRDGDVLEGVVTGTNPTTITVYINDVQLMSVQDTGQFGQPSHWGPWTTGSPGIGFYNNRHSSWSDFGFSSFSAHD